MLKESKKNTKPTTRIKLPRTEEIVKIKEYIPKDKIKEYIGKTVFYQVKIFDEIPIKKTTISAIDESNGHIVYSDGSHDLISQYESCFVYWENEPT